MRYMARTTHRFTDNAREVAAAGYQLGDLRARLYSGERQRLRRFAAAVALLIGIGTAAVGDRSRDIGGNGSGNRRLLRASEWRQARRRE